MFLIAAASNTFWSGLGVGVGAWLMPLLIGAATVAGLVFLSKKGKEKVQYATAALTIVRRLFADKLGDKATVIIDAWLAGLESMKDGDFSTEDGVDEFVRFIQIAAQHNKVDLDESELAIIRDAIIATLGMLNISEKPTQKAVQVMMASVKA